MSFEPLENFFDFLDTPERMQKKCDDLEREIKNDPTDEKKKRNIKNNEGNNETSEYFVCKTRRR